MSGHGHRTPSFMDGPFQRVLDPVGLSRLLLLFLTLTGSDRRLEEWDLEEDDALCIVHNVIKCGYEYSLWCVRLEIIALHFSFFLVHLVALRKILNINKSLPWCLLTVLFFSLHPIQVRTEKEEAGRAHAEVQWYSPEPCQARLETR